MNKFIISSLHGITLLVLIVYSIFFLFDVSQKIFNFRTNYNENGSGGWEFTNNNYPVRMNLSFLNDTTIQFKEKVSSNLQIGSGGFNLSDDYVGKDSFIVKLKEKIIKHKTNVEIDTIVGNFEAKPASHHPFTKGLKTEIQQVTTISMFSKKEMGKIPHVNHIIPYDSLIKKPVFKVGRISNINGLVEISPTNTRDKILLKIPSWLGMIVQILLIYQLFQILRNIKKGIIFSKQNIAKIQIIGILMIGLFIVDILTEVIYNVYLISSITHRAKYLSEFYKPLGFQAISNFSMNLHKEIVFTNLYVGLITLILATIFKRGLALQQEQDLTV
jgi:Protein of unknown function (DUF2975)